MQFVEINFFTQSTFETGLDSPTEYSSDLTSQIGFTQSDQTNPSEQFQSESSHQSSKDSQSSKSLVKKSVLHNMQKHLFTFVLNAIPTQKNCGDDLSQIELCSNELFTLLQSEKRKTKQSLQPIFGEYDERKMMNSPQYSYLLDKYCRSTIMQAKDLCKELIMQKMSLDDIQIYIHRSKVSKKEEFEQYLKTFRQQVLENKFGSRITQKSQKQIKQETEWTKVLNLN